MKKVTVPLVAAATSLTLVLSACGSSDDQSAAPAGSSAENIAAVAPALADYNDSIVEGELWTRADMSPRDRSLVTVSALISRNQTADLAAEINRGLDNGLTPAEISEIITHLAFYSSWPNAIAAAQVVGPVFEDRGIDAADLPGGEVDLLPQDAEAEQQRQATVAENYGDTAPGVLEYTTDAVFGDLWLRPDLAPRDRSLATYSALVANGQTGQIGYHLGRALDNGLTPAEASESLTQLAFYAGWPNVFSAMPVVSQVLEAR